MIIMPVGKDSHIHGGKVDTQRGSIFGKQTRLPHIKENLMVLGFYI